MNQLVSVSLLTIIASSSLTDTLAARVVDRDIMGHVCQPSKHLLKPAYNFTKTAIENVKSLATEFFQRELQREYENALAHIHTFKNEWNVIKDIPKEPNKPTPPNVLNNMNEQDTLSKIFTDLHLVRHGIIERDLEAADIIMSREDAIMFDAFEKDILQIINKILELLRPFKVKKIPEIPKANKHLPPSEERTEYGFRNWVIIHDYVILLEYTNDVVKHLLKKYCGIDAH